MHYIVLSEQVRFKKNVWKSLHWRSGPGEFQTLGPATEKARQP